MMRLLVLLFILKFAVLSAQSGKFYKLNNDSLLLTDTKKLILVYYTQRACFDCFISINDYLKQDISTNYYFIIEKTGSAINNYEMYTKLAAKGVLKSRILFTKTQSQMISPFLKIHFLEQETTLPYDQIFEDKTTLLVSAKFKKIVLGE